MPWRCDEANPQAVGIINGEAWILESQHPWSVLPAALELVDELMFMAGNPAGITSPKTMLCTHARLPANDQYLRSAIEGTK